MTEKKTILVLCTGNSARSQMAEGIIRNRLGDRFDVESAGTHPSSVRPEAIAALAEIGIDISGHRSKSVDEFAGRELDYVLTVCDNAREACPYFPASVSVTHRSFDDPAEATGPDSIGKFRKVRDEIAAYVDGEFRTIIGQE